MSISFSYRTQSGERVTNLVAGLVTFFNVWLDISNTRDDAYLTQLTFDEPIQQLSFIRIEPRNVRIFFHFETFSVISTPMYSY